MEITAALALGRRLLREHSLDDWRVVADHAKTRAGACRFRTKTISLSRPLTALHDEELVRDTILHEIAHALVGPTHGHDRVWRATARQIGCSGERLVSADAPRVEGDWRGQCAADHAAPAPPTGRQLLAMLPHLQPPPSDHVDLPRSSRGDGRGLSTGADRAPAAASPACRSLAPHGGSPQRPTVASPAVTGTSRCGGIVELRRARWPSDPAR